MYNFNSKENQVKFIVDRLSTIPAIRNGKFTVYSNVPARSVVFGHLPEKPPLVDEGALASDAEIIIDCMICCGEDILMCIMIDADDGGKETFDDTAIGPTFVTLKITDDIESRINPLFWQLICMKLVQLEWKFEKKYELTLSNVLTLDLACEEVEEIYGEKPFVISSHDNEQATEHGNPFGIFNRYDIDPISREVTCIPVITENLLPNLICDESDESPCEQMRIGAAFRELLDAPLEKFRKKHRLEYRKFIRSIRRIKRHIFSKKLKVPHLSLKTYMDFIEYIYLYYETVSEKEEGVNRAVKLCIEALKCLIKVFFPAEGCDHLIASMTLEEYFYAASQLLKSSYPLMLYLKIKSRISIPYSNAHTFCEYARFIGIERDDSRFHGLDIFEDLMILLVEPIANDDYSIGELKKRIFNMREELLYNFDPEAFAKRVRERMDDPNDILDDSEVFSDDLTARDILEDLETNGHGISFDYPGGIEQFKKDVESGMYDD